MIADLLLPLVTIVMLLVGTVTRPTRARCPQGFHMVDGVRTADGPLGHRGSFRCARPPIGGDDDVLTGKSTAIEPPGELRGRIYCTGGTMPIVVESTTVGCQRGGWQQ